MEDEFEVRYQMFRTVAEFGRVNAQLISVSESLTQNFAILTGYVAEISSKNRLFSSVTAGKAKGKAEKKSDLIDFILSLAGPLFSYASQTKNPELQAVADLNLFKLTHLRDTELSTTGSNLISAVNLNIAHLSGRAIYTEDVQAAEACLNEYDSAMDNKEFSMGKKKAAKQTMIETIAKANLLIKNQIDKDMQIFRKKNPDLLREYLASRVIKNIGQRHEPEPETENPKVDPGNSNEESGNSNEKTGNSNEETGNSNEGTGNSTDE